MAKKKPRGGRRPKEKSTSKPELVAITGLSGSGKASVLKALEDLGFYSVDNLPVELIPKFAELIRDNPAVKSAAIVVDIREGKGLSRFPEVFASIRRLVNAKLIFLEAEPDILVRRFSETRRPTRWERIAPSSKASRKSGHTWHPSARRQTSLSTPPSSRSTSCASLSASASGASGMSRTS